MANLLKEANLEVEKSRIVAEKRLEGLRRYKTSKINYEMVIGELIHVLPQITNDLGNIPSTS